MAKAHGEILANTANINVIATICKSHVVATRELGELLNNDELKEIEPSSTNLLGIKADPEENEITFMFVANGKIQASAIAQYIIWICLVGITISSLVYTYMLNKKSSKRNNYDTVNASD